ncbi:MAG: ABC transporter ATP-binding protein [Candidatus Puniceispirillaceae bacterium]
MSEPQTDPILTARGIGLARNGARLLQDISLDIRKGSITLVLGHNGAGKTLLLNALHGLIDIDHGNIYAPPLSQQKMVFQKPIIMRRTTRQHFQFLCRDLDPDDVADWIQRAGIADRIDAPARALSGGEQQKLALVGALAARPDILFLDEPTAHLDFAATKFVEAMIGEAHEAGTTIVMTSHNRAQSERLGQDVLLLDGGRLVEAATADKFFSSPDHPLSRQYLDHL